MHVAQLICGGELRVGKSAHTRARALQRTWGRWTS